MIELRPEMEQAYARVVGVNTWLPKNHREGLADVFAIVERDNVVYKRTPGPFAPVPDRERCDECHCPTEWHRAGGCDGDFGHCPCSVRKPS